MDRAGQRQPATNRRELVTLDAGFHDGIRADVDGNIWCGTGFGGEESMASTSMRPTARGSARS